jgi:hypothetical protein
MKIQGFKTLDYFITEHINVRGGLQALPKYIHSEKAMVYEGGNAIDNARPLNQEETKLVYDFVQKKVYPILGLEGNGIDASPIGSFGKKNPEQLSGDIDIAVSADKIASANGVSFENVLDKMEELLSTAGYSTKKVNGLSQVSVGIQIPGTDDYAQVDLMLSTNLEWSTFMYHSPDFTKAESKYKGLYRNTLMMAVVSEMTKEATKTTDKGEVEEYKQYVIRLNDGVYSVAKSFMGKKGSLVKTASLLKDQDKFISNTPDVVVKLAFGEKTVPADVMTFENTWNIITSKDFIHKDKLKNILEKFKMYLLNSKAPFPTEVVEAYPNIFEN